MLPASARFVGPPSAHSQLVGSQRPQNGYGITRIAASSRQSLSLVAQLSSLSTTEAVQPYSSQHHFSPASPVLVFLYRTRCTARRMEGIKYKGAHWWGASGPVRQRAPGRNGVNPSSKSLTCRVRVRRSWTFQPALHLLSTVSLFALPYVVRRTQPWQIMSAELIQYHPWAVGHPGLCAIAHASHGNQSSYRAVARSICVPRIPRPG